MHSVPRWPSRGWPPSLSRWPRPRWADMVSSEEEKEERSPSWRGTVYPMPSRLKAGRLPASMQAPPPEQLRQEERQSRKPPQKMQLHQQQPPEERQCSANPPQPQLGLQQRRQQPLEERQGREEPQEQLSEEPQSVWSRLEQRLMERVEEKLERLMESKLEAFLIRMTEMAPPPRQPQPQRTASESELQDRRDDPDEAEDSDRWELLSSVPDEEHEALSQD